jgi:hypothetical protein
MDKSESIVELAKALCEVQKTELFALTDKKNPFFKSKYADLSSVWDAIRLPLTSNGLAITQTTTNSNADGAMARKHRNKAETQKTTIQEPDVPDMVIGKTDVEGTETVEEFFARKKMSNGEIVEFNDYLLESAKLLGMDMKTLKRNAEAAGDLEDMLESVIKRRGAKEQANGNWWDQSKHWSFREKDVLKELILFGFGKEAEHKVCIDNPGAYNMLKTALPETKKILVKKYDKMFRAGEFNKLIKK